MTTTESDCYVRLVVPKDACAANPDVLRPLFERVDVADDGGMLDIECQFEGWSMCTPLPEVWSGLEECVGGKLDRVPGLRLDLAYTDRTYGDEEYDLAIRDGELSYMSRESVMAFLDDELLERHPYMVSFRDGDGPCCTNIAYAHGPHEAEAAYGRKHDWSSTSSRPLRQDEVDMYARRGMPLRDVSAFGDILPHERHDAAVRDARDTR